MILDDSDDQSRIPSETLQAKRWRELSEGTRTVGFLPTGPPSGRDRLDVGRDAKSRVVLQGNPQIHLKSACPNQVFWGASLQLYYIVMLIFIMFHMFFFVV